MWRRHSLAVGATILALLVPAGTAGAAEKSLWGPNTFPVGHSECPNGPRPCSAFPLYKRLGVDTFQFQIPWSQVAPSRPANPRNPNDPAYHWPSSADFIVQQASANGIALATMVKSTPNWANGGRAVSYAPHNPQDYADFLVAASQRYPFISRWMIWGEPNYGYNFQPMPAGSAEGPRRYAALLDAAYGGIKSVDRGDIVIGGMTLNAGMNVTVPDFIRWLRIGKGKKRRPPRTDWWGHNPFEARYPDISDKPIGKRRGLNDVDTLRKDLKRAYVGKKKCKKRKGKKRKCKKRKTPRLWLSEWSVLSDHPSTVFIGFYVSRQEQASWLSAGYRMVNRLPYVAGLGWYRLDDQPNVPSSAAWGLMTSEGERKPSFEAFRTAP